MRHLSRTDNAKTDTSFHILGKPEQKVLNPILYRTCALCYVSADSAKYRFLHFTARQEEDINEILADARKFYRERIES